MSYTPTEWKAGDTVTSAKLNKLEQGVASSGGGSLVVPVFTLTLTPGKSEGQYDVTCDMTYEEVLAAVESGRCCMAKALYSDDEDNIYYYRLESAGKDSEDHYYVGFYGAYVNSSNASGESLTLYDNGRCEYGREIYNA